MLGKVEDYLYLTMSNNTVIKNVDDKKQLKETLTSMKNIFKHEQTDEIFRILSAILHIGNLKFDLNEMDDSGKLNHDSIETATKISDLLKIDKAEFQNFLTFKSSEVGSQTIQTNYQLEEAN